MTSRDTILSDIGKAKPQRAAPLPDVGGNTTTTDDLFAVFESNLKITGAQVHRTNKDELIGDIRNLLPGGGPAYFGDIHVDGFSPVASLTSVTDLDGAILFACSGTLGVAENGAIWVSESNCVSRAALFLPESVVLVIDVESIVPSLHEAYDRIKIDHDGFGIFVAGPSKTADIEQSLVIGAHGPRSLHVFVY